MREDFIIDNRQKLRIYRKWLWIGVRESVIDLFLIAKPVFVMTGVIAGCAKFWVWVFAL